MGVEGTCRSGNRGALVLCSPYGRHPLLSSVLPLCTLLHIIRAKSIRNGAKLEFIWCALVFSRDFGIPEGAKSKHIFENVVQDVGQVVQDVRALAACSCLSLVQVVGELLLFC